jgi:hypothetical protein
LDESTTGTEVIYKKRLHPFDIGNLSKFNVNALMSDGRFMNLVLVKQIPYWFRELGLIETTEEYMTYRDDDDVPYLVRVFTNGLKFMPSSQLGSGREYDHKATKSKCEETVLIACDITEMTSDHPFVTIRFVYTKELLETYPNATIPVGEREDFFGIPVTIDEAAFC